MRQQQTRSHKSLVWVGLFSLLLAGTVWGSYELYTFRARQNTGKLLARAESAVAAENWAGAAAAYRQYLQRELDDVDALRSYADVLLESIETTPEALGDALRTLRRVVGLQPDNADAIAKLTVLYLRIRENTQAMELASDWIALAPTSAKASLALATAQHRLDRSREAADTLVAAIARNPDEPEPYAMLVKLLTGELKQPDEAAKWLEEALRVGPNTVGVQLAAFVYSEDRGELKDAERHLRQALDLAPDSLDTLLPAGLFYLAHDRLDEAATHLDRAAQIAPQSPTVLAVRAMWATRTGRPADLIATADEFFRAAGENHAGLFVQAAELYLGADELGRIDDCLAKIDVLPPVGKQLETRLDALRGTRAFQEGDYYSAIRHLRSAANQEPPSARALQLSAAAQAQLGDLDGAAEACERLIRLTPGSVDARLRLAELEWERGRLDRTDEILSSLPGASAGQQYEADLMRLACDLAAARRSGRPTAGRASSLEELDRLASIAPTEAFPTRWLVRCFALSGQPQRAVDIFHARLGDAGFRPRLGMELGRYLLSDGLGKQVLTLADKLIRRFPDAPQGYILQVRALAATDGLPQAKAYVDRNDLPVSAKADVLEALADEYLDADQTETALGLYRQAADLMTNNVSVRRKLVRSTSDLDEAVLRSEEIRAVEGDAGVQWKFEQANALLRLDPADKATDKPALPSSKPASPVARARELLKQCLADRPRWPSARLLLGYAHELSGELHDAAEAYGTALARNPALRGEPAAARLVQLQYRLGRTTEADALLETLIEDFPDQPDILRIRTEQQIRQRNFQSALTTAERVLQLQPDDTAWAVVTADLHLRVADPARAEAIARAYLDRSPDSTTVLWILARALIDQQRGAEALTQVRQAVVAAGDASHYVLLARVLAPLGQDTETELAITKAQTLAPDDAAIWAACADVWGSIGRRSQQTASMRKSVKLRGEDPAISLALARLLAAGGTAEDRQARLADREEASRIVQQRLSANPQDAEAIVLRGQLAMLSTRPDPASAEADFLQALSINPRLPQAHRLLGLIRMQIGRVDAARASINSGLALAPHDPALLLASCELYSAAGDYERAIRQLHMLLDVQPRMPAALRMLANAYRATNQIDQGIAFIETHAPRDVRNAGEIVLLAKLHESKQDVERAGLLFEQATAKDQISSDVHQELLRFLARRKNISEIHDLAVTRRQEQPADVRSFAVAAQMLGSQKVNYELRQIGMGWLAIIAREHPEHAADATYRAAVCHYGQRELQEAESKFLEARRLAPANPDLVNNLAWLYAVDLGKPADAVALIEQFLADGGREDDHLLDTHCVALIRLGKLAAAEHKVRKCLSITGNTSTRTAATFHLGVVLMKSGRESEARPHLRRASQLDAQLGGLTAREREDLRRMLEPTAPNLDTGTGQPGD